MCSPTKSTSFQPQLLTPPNVDLEFSRERVASDPTRWQAVSAEAGTSATGSGRVQAFSQTLSKHLKGSSPRIQIAGRAIGVLHRRAKAELPQNTEQA